jgi:hypothetical protein
MKQLPTPSVNSTASSPTPSLGRRTATPPNWAPGALSPMPLSPVDLPPLEDQAPSVDACSGDVAHVAARAVALRAPERVPPNRVNSGIDRPRRRGAYGHGSAGTPESDICGAFNSSSSMARRRAWFGLDHEQARVALPQELLLEVPVSLSRTWSDPRWSFTPALTGIDTAS